MGYGHNIGMERMMLICRIPDPVNGSGNVGCCFVLGMVQYRYCGWSLEIENGGYGPAESMHDDVTSGYLFVLT